MKKYKYKYKKVSGSLKRLVKAIDFFVNDLLMLNALKRGHEQNFEKAWARYEKNKNKVKS